MADNTRFLAQAAADRHHATVVRADHAIEELDRTGQPISFCAVAKTANVSRAWLYRQPDVRDLIIRLRTAPSRPAANPANQRATTESLRQLLDAARHEIAQLRADNLNLRDQLARSLGHQRTRP
jgi:hypothetical protein